MVRALPQVEEEDIRVILEVLAQRMLPGLQQATDDWEENQQPDAKTLQRMARDAAYWIARHAT